MFKMFWVAVGFSLLMGCSKSDEEQQRNQPQYKLQGNWAMPLEAREKRAELNVTMNAVSLHKTCMADDGRDIDLVTSVKAEITSSEIKVLEKGSPSVAVTDFGRRYSCEMEVEPGVVRYKLPNNDTLELQFEGSQTIILRRIK